MAHLPDPALEVPFGTAPSLDPADGRGQDRADRAPVREGASGRDDDAVTVPVWLEGREAMNGLEDAVRFRLDQGLSPLEPTAPQGANENLARAESSTTTGQ